MAGIIEQFIKSRFQTKIFLLFAISYTIVIIITTAYSYMRVNHTDVEETEERKQIYKEIYKN